MLGQTVQWLGEGTRRSFGDRKRAGLNDRVIAGGEVAYQKVAQGPAVHIATDELSIGSEIQKLYWGAPAGPRAAESRPAAQHRAGAGADRQLEAAGNRRSITSIASLFESFL
jgi:hypothetical protein